MASSNNGQLSTIVDALSKGVAALAIALYAAGFLIVSISHSRYGFTETNPFRPKILAAGAWFFIFTGIPIVTIVALGKGRLSWMRSAQLLYFYYLSCIAFSLPAAMLFKSSAATADTTTADTTPINWWLAAGISAFFVILIYLAMSKPKIVPPVVTAIASVLVVIFFIQYTVHEILVAHFGCGVISLWFFGVGVAAQVDLNISSWDLAKNLTNADWAKTLFVILGALLVFASLYYPHMKSSWGGGSPIDAVFYFNKDSVLKPNQSVPVQLVDESDAGFYIVGTDESRAIFVPRNSVLLIYFSDEPSDSILLK
jgi:hypothetical protein